MKYLFVTHQETPHCGGLGRVLKTFPDAILRGDVSDYHLAFPEYEHRMRWMKEGDDIDRGRIIAAQDATVSVIITVPIASPKVFLRFVRVKVQDGNI